MPHLTPPNLKFKAIKLVIFDWSGVISDDRKPVYEANKIVVEKHGVEHENFQNWRIHTNASAPLYFASRGITADPDVLMNEYRDALHRARASGIHPVIYPDVIQTLEGLFPKKQFVVSMHPTNHLLKEAHDYGIAAYFSDIIGEVKDKSVAIKKILGDSMPASAIYVGDTIFDIQAAKKAGVISAGVPTGYQTKDVLSAENPDVMLEKLSDILNYL